LSSVNARGIHLSQTLGSCNTSTMTCCTVPKNRPRPDAVRRSVTHMSVRPCDFLDARRFGACHPDTSSSTSFDVRHIVPARCKDVGPFVNQVPWRHIRALHLRALPMCIAWDTFCACTKPVTPTYRRGKFSNWATVLTCRSCAPSARVPRIAWPSALEPCVIYINCIWNFEEFGFSDGMAGSFFDYTLVKV
jgi:hypothetical protein